MAIGDVDRRISSDVLGKSVCYRSSKRRKLNALCAINNPGLRQITTVALCRMACHMRITI
jgi:hypothetical protein